MNTIHIFHIKHEEKIPEEIFRKNLLLLPENFQKDINAYKHRESAQSSLLGKMLLLYGFKKLNLPYVLQDLKIGSKDRPYINTEMDFNISHSGAYVICAIAQNARVGIDIEKHRTLKMNIAERFFNEQECLEIDSSEQPEQAFFDFWSIKEAAIKCDGRGVEVLSKTHVLSAPNKHFANDNKVLCDGNTFCYQKLEIDAGYSAAVCSTADFDINLCELQLTDLV
ncbi:MAG: 4'-phosphopantetheinyl transferase superfamily protein [Chitinophagales bacterium]|nr:4'-phosphopantetheinyl transferase superfamily protein [Chitinophagales bacterium]